ncbi:PilN domain-containing protein [Chitinibacter sp. S2-10]|uniref:PilN domain-containing protein n=1 Tax=Chitinibacter sp. S2-10 TaxID=3373597 RepID=UPI00397783A1
MIRINLLPHRQEKRVAKQKRFVGMMVFAFLAGCAVVIAGYVLLGTRIEAQNARNEFLAAENAKLDKEIAEIEKLKAEKQALLDRKLIVERLQSNRTETVHLMDQLTRQVPEGVYLKDVKQTNELLVLGGYAQSNARVSTLMRNLNDSAVFEQPLLVEAKAASVGNQRLSDFTLNVKLTRVAADASAVVASSAQAKGKK